MARAKAECGTGWPLSFLCNAVCLKRKHNFSRCNIVLDGITVENINKLSKLLLNSKKIDFWKKRVLATDV